MNHVVVNLHWGGRIENGMFPDWEQPQIARKLIDAGADLIIGHHSHTVQPYEIYKGKYIFYSLGNFCFDDIYHEDKLYSKLSPQQKNGLMVHISFSEYDYEVNLNLVRNNNRNINFLPNLGFLRRRNFVFLFIKNIKVLWRIYFLNHRIIIPLFNYFFVQKGSIRNILDKKKFLTHLKKIK